MLMVGQCEGVALVALLLATQCLLGVGGVSSVGVYYPAHVARTGLDIAQLQSHGVNKVRIDDTDPVVLRSLARTNIEVVVGVKNDEIPTLAASEGMAQAWVAQNIFPHIPATIITYVAVGHEVLTGAQNFSDVLVVAMRNLYTALVSMKLDQRIKVSTPNSVVLLKISFPPSSGSFQESYSTPLDKLLSFLSETGAPFMMNVYPYNLRQDFLGVFPLEYYLFKSNSGTDDPKTGLHYDNYLGAILDSTIVAIEALNHGNISVLVSETSWPSRDEISQTYNQNLQTHVQNHPGTPMRPEAEIDIYLTGLFDVAMHRLTLDTYSGRPRARKLATQQWCIAKPNLENAAYQGALDWVCGPLSGQGQVNCGPIQSGQSCYLPNTYYNHASWAFNAYYQTHGQTSQSCDFQGTAVITTTDPSTSTCPYTASNSTSSSGSTSSGSSNSGAYMFSKSLLRIFTVIAVLAYLMTVQVF